MNSSTTPTRNRYHLPALVIVLLLLGGVVSWLGLQSGRYLVVPQPAGDDSSRLSPQEFPVTEAIVLPHDPPLLPPGPHRDTFITNCTICHSTRLVVNQPNFPRVTWEKTVEKMAVTYGGPITAENRPKIVEYLVSIRGQD